MGCSERLVCLGLRTSKIPTGAALGARTCGRVDLPRHKGAGAFQLGIPLHGLGPYRPIQSPGCRLVVNLCLLATAVLNSFTDFFFAPNATSGNSFLVDGVDYYNNLAITITRVMGDNCRWYKACIVFDACKHFGMGNFGARSFTPSTHEKGKCSIKTLVTAWLFTNANSSPDQRTTESPIGPFIELAPPAWRAKCNTTNL